MIIGLFCDWCSELAANYFGLLEKYLQLLQVETCLRIQ